MKNAIQMGWGAMIYIVTFLGVCDYGRGMDWILDLLIIFIHNSELQVITALLLISTLQITPR
jgi:hypothetical protein